MRNGVLYVSCDYQPAIGDIVMERKLEARQEGNYSSSELLQLA